MVAMPVPMSAAAYRPQPAEFAHTRSRRPLLSEPVYRQLARLCRSAIEANQFRIGDRFPSERELAKQHGVSRVTANKAIASLVAEHLLEQRPGLGAFVSGNKNLQASLRDTESFTGHARSAGFIPSTRVLSFEKRTATDLPEFVRRPLALGPHSAEPVFEVVRLRLADGEPVILENRWILARHLPRLTRRQMAGSFYAILEAAGVEVTGEEQIISARNATTKEAATLAAPRSAALLVVEGPGYTRGREALWHQVLLYRGDRYRLRNETLPAEQRQRTIVEYNGPLHEPVRTPAQKLG